MIFVAVPSKLPHCAFYSHSPLFGTQEEQSNAPGQNSNEWLNPNLDLFIVMTCRVIYKAIFLLVNLVYNFYLLHYLLTTWYIRVFVFLKASEEVFIVLSLIFLSLAHARISIIRAVLFNRLCRRSVSYRS